MPFTFPLMPRYEQYGVRRRVHDDYLDMLFVHPDCQRQGIAQTLFKQATASGPRDLEADVSITARPFFEAMGFRVVKRQEVERCGVKLNNFHMRPVV